MFPQRVHPDVLWELGIAHRDVSRHALGEALAGKVTEDGGGVDEDVFAVFGMSWEGWDSWETLDYGMMRSFFGEWEVCREMYKEILM